VAYVGCHNFAAVDVTSTRFPEQALVHITVVLRTKPRREGSDRVPSRAVGLLAAAAVLAGLANPPSLTEGGRGGLRTRRSALRESGDQVDRVAESKLAPMARWLAGSVLSL
jgi:hypothetical protein